MTTDGSLVQQGRAAIETVTQRVRSDSAYAERFKEQPVELLLEAGAPAEGMTDILRETGFSEDDVAGYALTLGISSPTIGSGGITGGTRPTVGGVSSPTAGGGSIGGVRPGGIGSAAECSGTCNCSSSCLFTF